MSEPTRWISVGELAHAFAPDSNAAGLTSDLASKTLNLSLEDGTSLRYRFETKERLYWSAADGSGSTAEQGEQYFAARVRPGIYFVDHVRGQFATTCISLVIDLSAMIVTVVTGRLPDAAESAMSLTDRATKDRELTAVGASFVSGAVDGPFTKDTPRHLPTREMVGKRVEYTYTVCKETNSQEPAVETPLDLIRIVRPPDASFNINYINRASCLHIPHLQCTSFLVFWDVEVDPAPNCQPPATGRQRKRYYLIF